MRRWRTVFMAAVLAAMLVLCGCSATAQISLDVRPNGTGAVVVTVTLDKAAVASVGDVAAELQTGDLAAAGWTVTGPSPGAAGSMVVTASKPFTSFAQASSIVEEIAGTGTPSTRPFQVAISRHRSFWKTTTTLNGDVDLRCGLACFGDPGLQTAIGSATGINPATAQHDTGVNPTTIFHFGVAVTLPGKLHATNAGTHTTSSTEAQLGWTPTLGAEVPLMAVTETTNTTHVKEVAIAVGVGVLVLLVLAGWWLWWVLRRRRRRRSRHLKV